MTSLAPHQQTKTPDYQTGDKAIVLGAREGNIGGAIAARLCRAGWIAQEDDCYRSYEGHLGLNYRYQAPHQNELKPYDACVITLGTTLMRPFSEVGQSDFVKVLRGSLELPLECARRYVHARKLSVHGGPHRYPGAPGYNPENPGDCYTSDCEHGCGCWAGPSRSGGPDGIDPFGACPNAPRTDHHSTIVFVGSYANDHPFTHCTSYCVAKAGLDMAARSLAWELMPEGFDVHIIHPNHVEGTPMTDEIRKGMQKGHHKMTAKEAVEYQHKDLGPRMGRLLESGDIAEMVLWLLTSDQARWLSGTGVRMYGGCR